MFQLRYRDRWMLAVPLSVGATWAVAGCGDTPPVQAPLDAGALRDWNRAEGNGGAGDTASPGGHAGPPSEADGGAARDGGPDATLVAMPDVGADGSAAPIPDAAEPCVPSTEVCDALDDDCDGQVDEGLARACYEGPEATAGTGPCTAGESVCVGGAWQPCIGQILPGEEICDGTDNDCDGVADDGDLPAGACLCMGEAARPCYGGPPGSEDLGTCAAGLQTCDPDGQRWGPCEGQSLPGDEICDGQDNDCDGTSDESADVFGWGFPCEVGVGACRRAGAMACDPAAGLVCFGEAGMPVAETCDGQDEDCDGVVDNGFDLGADCQRGVGACRAEGVTVCDQATGSAKCGAVPPMPSDEVCDGVDNDCDGDTDEADGELCNPGTICIRGRCAGLAPPGYVRIEPGAFVMGSPEDEPGHDPPSIHLSTDERQHPVTLTRPFALKSTEVTQAEWLALMGTSPSFFANCGDTCPVENVSWFGAVDYANRLSDLEGLPRCYADDDVRSFVGLDCPGYRLPTEAEWEYAARAGTVTAFHTGDITQTECDPVDPNLDAAGWYCGNAGRTTHPVGQKQPNAWGLYDMHGNVSEWVYDWYVEGFPEDEVDPIGPPRFGDHRWPRVYRGGAFSSVAMAARAASRQWYDWGFSENFLGFRPARTLP